MSNFAFLADEFPDIHISAVRAETLALGDPRASAFYARLTDMAATGEAGVIDEVTSPDDNLQAVFKYLVKQ